MKKAAKQRVQEMFTMNVFADKLDDIMRKLRWNYLDYINFNYQKRYKLIKIIKI